MTIDNKAIQWLRCNRDIARELPAFEDGTWLVPNMEHIDGNDVETLKQHGIIRHEEKIYTGQHYRWKWRTVEGAAEKIKANITFDHPGPCNHTGVRTLTAGEQYTCCNDECDATFGREIAEERL